MDGFPFLDEPIQFHVQQSLELLLPVVIRLARRSNLEARLGAGDGFSATFMIAELIV
jgi:hypothetical protein